MNVVLVYFGIVGIIIGGLGLAFEAAVPGRTADVEVTSSVRAVPAMPATGPRSEGSAWPAEPRDASVPFSDHMLQLVRPAAPVPEPVATTAKPEAEVDVTVGIGSREPERARPQRKARPKPKQRVSDPETTQVEVRDQYGRRLRTGPVPRERVERPRRDNSYGGFFGGGHW
jgi:hypothetical protein